MRYARNNSTSLHYDLKSLPSFARWLARYWWESSPERLAAAGRDMLPLISSSVSEHDKLIARAGLQYLVRPSGWLEAYRTKEIFERETLVAHELARQHGLGLEVLDAAGLRAMEPALNSGYAGAVHWLDPKTISDPGALTKGYAKLFEAGGGTLARGDALTLSKAADEWTVLAESGPLSAKTVVLALGPWSDQVFRKFGYRIPLMSKRGYHMHYARPGVEQLKLPVIDIEEGFAVAPMDRGIRISTGVEIAKRGMQPTPIQLDRAEGKARSIFGLGERLDERPWLGMRPCTPDMRPVIGRAPHHPGLWFSFGHNHHGFTLGPGSGRLLAEMVVGNAPFVDPSAFRPERFHN